MSVELLLDGMMSGTGVRDAINGGYIELAELGLTDELIRDIQVWQTECREVHIQGHPERRVLELDRAGLVLLDRLRIELPGREIGYFSDGRMERLA